MITAIGTFQDGYVKLDKDYTADNPVKVIVTFLEDVQEKPQKVIGLSNFSFAKSQHNLEALTSSLSEAVIDERRSAL